MAGELIPGEYVAKQKDRCPTCGGSGRVALEEQFVTRDMAMDAGDLALKGQSLGFEEGGCPDCNGSGRIGQVALCDVCQKKPGCRLIMVAGLETWACEGCDE